MKKWIFLITLTLLLSHCYGEGADLPRKKRFNIESTLFSLPMVGRELHDLWNTFLREPNIDLQGALFRSKEHEIIGRIHAINGAIKVIDGKVGTITSDTVSQIFAALPIAIRTEFRLEEVAKILDQIDIAHNDFTFYLESQNINGSINFNTTSGLTAPTKNRHENEEVTYEKTDDLLNEVNYNSEALNIKKRAASKTESFTLQNFATWVTGPASDSIKTLLERLHKLIMPSNNRIWGNGIFDTFIQQHEVLAQTMCELHESPHQLLYNLYNVVQMADFKGFALLQFSYIILKLYDKGNFTAESARETEKFETRMTEKVKAIKNTLTNADRSVYNCDPKQYVENQNYVKLTKLLQGYIENEVNLNPYGTCRENCAYYLYTEYHGCYKEQFCARQEPCRGRVVECTYVDSDMNICKSSDPGRRYDWIEYENGVILGNKGKCRMRDFYKVDSWWRYLFWHCSYCRCLCDDGNYESDRYFNLRPVTSDIENNKVITGVRIKKHNKIIHMQIQEGVLKPKGVIDKSTISWKPVDNYTISDRNVENGVDYHTMNWMDRILDLDDAVGPNESVLTGIRFRKLGNHLNVEIRTTPINFTSGQVLSEIYSEWISNDNTEISLPKARKEVVLTDPDIPIRNGPHTINSQHDQFVKFQPSSFITDAAQTTVPFLDSQPLISRGSPVSGFGLIHRGKPGSGGFIAPKLITYNFVPHLS